MVLRKHEVDLCYRVDLVHRELPPVEPFVIGWRYPLMELRLDLSPDNMKKAKGGQTRKYDPVTLCAAIADATAESPVSISAWAEAARIPRQTLTDYLPGLRAKGWLATRGEGSAARQYLTEKGREMARHAKEAT
jgi:predicted transcriptional regulator